MDMHVDEADIRRIRQYIRANLFVTGIAGVGVLIAYLTVVSSRWLLVDCGIVFVAVGAFATALYDLERQCVGRALVISVLAHWSAGITTTMITPFVLPMITVIVLLPVVMLVPYLNRRQLGAAIAGSMSVAFAVTFLSRHVYVTDVEDRAPRWLIDVIVLVFIPAVIGLVAFNAWQNNVRNASQSEELRASRARLVAVTDNVRRQLERDLHDGAQQQLVAIAIRVGLLERLIEKNPVKAQELAAQLSAELQETITDVRNLAHGIYPALLNERGLVEALTAAGHRSPIAVCVTSDSTDEIRYAPEVEAAVYFTCIEAMQNSIKHAGADTITVNIRCEHGLDFTVKDNGSGFNVAAVFGGHGLNNMRDRIGAIGGQLSIVGTPKHGTTVAGTIPAQVAIANSHYLS